MHLPWQQVRELVIEGTVEPAVMMIDQAIGSVIVTGVARASLVLRGTVKVTRNPVREAGVSEGQGFKIFTVEQHIEMDDVMMTTGRRVGVSTKVDAGVV